ncbi:MAG: TIGR00296 family protein, partial [Candidatus Methanolliviera hydrocarbonicum]
PQDCWLDDSTEVYRFKGQIFEEKDGEIVEKKI